MSQKDRDKAPLSIITIQLNTVDKKQYTCINLVELFNKINKRYNIFYCEFVDQGMNPRD